MKAVVCPSCQEKNNPEFQNCWKCKAFLNNTQTRSPESFEEEWTRRIKERFQWGAFAGVLFAVGASLFGWQMSGYDARAIPRLLILFCVLLIPSLVIIAFMIFSRKQIKKGTGYRGDRLN